MPPVILWFRRNLRIADNAALSAAAASGRPVIPVYVAEDPPPGGASRWWLHRSLTALDAALVERGSALVVRRGNAAHSLRSIVDDSGATELYFARRIEPAARREERAVRKALGGYCDMHAFDDAFLCDFDAVRTRHDSPYKVFTPFWKAASARDPAAPAAAPGELQASAAPIASDGIDSLGLLPDGHDWTGGLRDAWEPGEAGAHLRLDAAADAARSYGKLRDRPDLDATTRLSPHLHFGEVSPRQVWHDVRSTAGHGADALLRQLYWREFSSYLLYHFPELPDAPLRDEFEHFPWVDDDELLHAWQRGMTGYPIVDAGMRQLWETGWMHNRVRMIVASFLVKDLLVPWQRGAHWFLDTLVDADLANNSASWQWVAGCGTDAAPYFRVFNPVLQGRKFDPDGEYVRRWVPEIRLLPNEFVHEPWRVDHTAQRSLDMAIGEGYPPPIIDHHEARNRALEAYETVKAHKAA